MSKSLGNFFTLREIFEKYDPMVVRYMLLTQHYRQPLDFSEDKLEQSKSAYERIVNAVGKANGTKDDNLDEQKFVSCMDDDFNTPQALAVIHNLVDKIFESKIDSAKTLLKLCALLGLVINIEIEIPDIIKKLTEEREQTRKGKNWKLSDELREKIRKEGFEVEDTKSGPKIKKL